LFGWFTGTTAQSIYSNCPAKISPGLAQNRRIHNARSNIFCRPNSACRALSIRRYGFGVNLDWRSG